MSNEAAQDELQQAINNITNGTMSSSDESSDALAEIESRLGGSAKGGKGSKSEKVDVSANADTASDADAAAKAASEAAAAAASATDIPTLPMVDATPATPAVDASAVSATLGAPALGATAPIPAPEAPAMPAMPDFMTAPVAAPVADTAVLSATPATPAVSTASVVNDPALNAVRSKALSDLRPLIDKIDVPAEKQYQLYKDILEATNDKSLVEPLYAAIGSIADEKTRAEALLYLIEKINTLG